MLDVVLRLVEGEILPDGKKSPQPGSGRGDFNVCVVEGGEDIRGQFVQSAILLDTMVDVERRDAVNQDADAVVAPAFVDRLGLFKSAEGGRVVCACRLARYGIDGQLGHSAVTEYTLPATEFAAFQLLRDVLKSDHLQYLLFGRNL